MASAPEHDDVTIRDAAGQSRFEAVVGGEVAGYAEYVRAGALVIFHHTKVADAFGGQGIGSRLVRGALDMVRDRGGAVVARCPYVRGWLERHPDYQDLQRPDPGGT